MSFKVTFNGKTATFDKKVEILSLIDNDPNEEIICAKVNNRIRELTYEISQDSTVEFLTVKDQDAIKTYETSLRYLVAMAFHNVYPNLDVRFSYHISRSIFVQIMTPGYSIDLGMVRRVQDEMGRIVKADYPLRRYKVTKEEAEKIYEEKGYSDKLALLKYRPEKNVHLYDCNGYLNYMFGHMVPSTGYIKKYKLRYYAPGILIQYPRYESKGEIPPFEDAPTFGKTLKESHKWGMKSGSDTVSGINEAIKRDGTVEFINVCEARHNRMLCELGQKIENNITDVRLICIAGPSSSGKTTFSNRLRIELLSRGIKPIRISIDDYYKARGEAPLDEEGKPDLESIEALDIELFNQNMVALISGEEVQLPKYDFKLGHRVPGRTLKVDYDQPIIIEGIHALNDKLTPDIPRHQKFKIYISPQAQINLDNHNPLSLTDLRLLRRLVRDFKFRNSSAEETISMWPSVRRGEFRWIYDTQEGADFVYNSLLPYELCVMKKYAQPLLQKIEKDSPYFPVAERLLRLLKYFDDMPEEWIPCNSLIREFIGGSCYADV